MTVNDFLQWLKTQKDMPPAELGKLDANKESFIALFLQKEAKVNAIGTPSSYSVMGVNIKIRYGKNFTAAQQKVQQIKEQLDNVRKTPMNNKMVLFINTEQPKYDGKDAKGVFEFTLKTRIFYERSS